MYPPRSPDIIPLDFYQLVLGYVKENAPQNNPQNLVRLKRNITNFISGTTRGTCGQMHQW